jgi:hypothetical protein
VMPLSAVYALAGRWPLGQLACQVWMSIDYTASTASILNLFALSVDRYWSVTSPLRYLHQRTKRRAAVMLTLTWCVSLLWLLPIALWHHAVNGGRRLVSPDVCDTEFSSSRPFKVISAIINYYLPLAVMVVLNINIFVEIRQRAVDFCDRCDKDVQTVQPRGRAENRERRRSQAVTDRSTQRRHLCKQTTIELESLSALPARALRDISEGAWSDNPLCQAPCSPSVDQSHRYRSLRRELQMLSEELDEEKSGTAAEERGRAAGDADDVISNCSGSDRDLRDQNHIDKHLLTNHVLHNAHCNEHSNHLLPPMINHKPRSFSGSHFVNLHATEHEANRSRSNSRFSDQILDVDNNANACELQILNNDNNIPQHSNRSSSSSLADNADNNDVIVGPEPVPYNRRRLSVDWAKVMDDIAVVRRRINSTFAVRESKAARQLCVIMTVFTVCFFPYFACYIIVAFYPTAVSTGLMRAVTWFGYINSTLNPVLYSLCNAQFRRTFRTYFRFRRVVSAKPSTYNYKSVIRLPRMSWRASSRTTNNTN